MRAVLLEQIKSIAPLPESVMEVEKIYKDLDAGVVEMQNAIQKDPLLVANILRLANSPFYGLKSKVNDLQRAVALLGKSAIRTFVLSSIIDSEFEIDLLPYGITPAQFRDASELQMALAMEWLSKEDKESCSIVAPAAFLGDIGRVLIARTLLQNSLEWEFESLLGAGVTLEEAELQLCGVNTLEVSAALFEQWGLAPELSALMRATLKPEDATQELQKMAFALKAIYTVVQPNATITQESKANAVAILKNVNIESAAFIASVEKIAGAQEVL